MIWEDHSGHESIEEDRGDMELQGNEEECYLGGRWKRGRKLR